MCPDHSAQGATLLNGTKYGSTKYVLQKPEPESEETEADNAEKPDQAGDLGADEEVSE